jgi:hypothetical protein
VLAGCSFEHGSVTRAPGDGRLIDTAVAIDAPDGSASDQIAFTNPLAGATPHTISLWINQCESSTSHAVRVGSRRRRSIKRRPAWRT